MKTIQARVSDNLQHGGWMKALSVRAPWWWAILHMGKDIENRDWPTRFRGRVLLYASRWFKLAQIHDDLETIRLICERSNTNQGGPAPDMQQTPSLSNPADYEQIDIHGCRDLTAEQSNEDGRIPVVVDDTNPQFFSVYARHHDRTCLCLTDHPTLADAVRVAAALQGAYSLPVVNHCNMQ